MKTIKIRILLTLLISVSLFACKKDTPPPPAKTPVMSKLNVIHATPAEEKLDVYLGGTKINTVDLSYSDKLGYLTVAGGEKEIFVTKKGLPTSLFKQTFTLNKDDSNSLFIIDKFAEVKFLLIKDELVAPATGKAKIRFVNLSPDAPALNMAIAGATADLITNKAFKEFSGFETIDPGEKVTFNFKNKATGAIETSAVDVKIEAGKNYTIWVKGLKANATGPLSFGASVFAH